MTCIVLILMNLLVHVASENSCLGVYKGFVREFKNDESWSNIGKCVLHRCQGHNQVIVERCPQVTIHEGCVLSKEDLNKHYPGCCGYPVCTEAASVMCTDPVDHTTHLPGAQWQPAGRCALKECGGDGLLLAFTCPIHELAIGCHYTEADLTLEFPNCCPKVVCEKKEDG